MSKPVSDVKPKKKPENFLDLTTKGRETAENSKREKPKKDTRRPKLTKKVIIAAVTAVIVIVSVAAYILYFQPTSELTNQQVIDRVQSLSDVPNSEIPTIATVEDAESLAIQDGFYSDAENGDIILVYYQSKRAILYRPDDNTIIKNGNVSTE
jgi:cell division protein FtsL